MTLPFQGTEVLLDNIAPLPGLPLFSNLNEVSITSLQLDLTVIDVFIRRGSVLSRGQFCSGRDD